MNVKLLLVLSLFVFQSGFSQTRTYLKGVVLYDNSLLQNVEVINKTSEKHVKTNENGEFLIAAKANDSLLFYSKNFYLKRIKISKELLEQNNLTILMIVKPEELEEVIVEKVEGISLKGSKSYEEEMINKYKTDKFDNTETPQAMRDGTFVNGLNFIAIGKKILQLISKDKENKKEAPEIALATLARKTCEPKFFTQTLKLKPEEIDLFLQFCDADPESKKLNDSSNVLSIMDFLTLKNKEFQKLKEDVK